MSTFCYYYTGDIDKAKEKVLEALYYSENIGHDGSIVFSYLHVALYYLFLGDKKSVKHYTEMYYSKHGKNRMEVWHTIFIDLLDAYACDDTKRAQSYFDEMIDSGQDFVAPLYAPFLSLCYLNDSDYDIALNIAEKYLNKSKEIKLRSAYSALYYVNALCIYFKGGCEYTSNVDSYLSKAIYESELQGAIYLELDFLCEKEKLSGDSNALGRIKEILDEESISTGSPAYQKAIALIN